MSIKKCCEIIKDYIDNKKDAHDVLCAESDLQQCCNDFAEEIKKQQDAYDILCPIKGEFMLFTYIMVFTRTIIMLALMYYLGYIYLKISIVLKFGTSKSKAMKRSVCLRQTPE